MIRCVWMCVFLRVSMLLRSCVRVCMCMSLCVRLCVCVCVRSEEHTSVLLSHLNLVCVVLRDRKGGGVWSVRGSCLFDDTVCVDVCVLARLYALAILCACVHVHVLVCEAVCVCVC